MGNDSSYSRELLPSSSEALNVKGLTNIKNEMPVTDVCVRSVGRFGRLHCRVKTSQVGVPVLVEILLLFMVLGQSSSPWRIRLAAGCQDVGQPLRRISLTWATLRPLSTVGLSRQVQEWGKLI